MNTFSVNGKSTVQIFFKVIPKRVNITNEKGELYFFRYPAIGYQDIKVNILHSGTYKVDCECTLIKVLPLTIHRIEVKLPPKQRDLEKPVTIKKNTYLNNTPARHFTAKGLIETGTKYEKQIKAIRFFILLHEYGHFFYKDEHFCDLFAVKNFVNMGYNNSTALYALTSVLGHSDANKKRVLQLFNVLKR